MLEFGEGHADVLPAAGVISAGNHKDDVEVILFLAHEIAANFRADLFGHRHRRAGGKRKLNHHRALILFRQKAASQFLILPEHQKRQRQGQQYKAEGADRYPPENRQVTILSGGDAAVETGEERPFFKMAGFEQMGAQRRRQGQCDQRGKHHRRNDGHAELPVDNPHRAAEKRHRDKNRREYQRDANQRAGYLIHRAQRGFKRGKILFHHQAFNVLHHHDSVINQQTDCQNHREEGERIDAVAQQAKDAEGTEQDDRHREGRDQRCPPALEKEIHDRHHKKNRLNQRAHYAFDRDRHERRAVARISGDNALRKAGRQAFDFCPDLLRRLQRVGPGGQLN